MLIIVSEQTFLQELRTVSGQVWATYREACQELNLPENDATLGHFTRWWIGCCKPRQIRQSLLVWVANTPIASRLSGKYASYWQRASHPIQKIFRKNTKTMSADILHRLSATNQNTNIQFASSIYNGGIDFNWGHMFGNRKQSTGTIGDGCVESIWKGPFRSRFSTRDSLWCRKIV